MRTPVAPATARAARSPCSVFRLWPLASDPSPARSEARAFTLLELLIVMSLIAVLASITLVIGRGISERSKVAQAKAEMAVLAAALEQYKQHYGDYPWTPEGTGLGTLPYSENLTGAQILFNALCGNIGPKGNQLPQKGRTLIDLSRFKLWSLSEEHMPKAESPDIVNNWLDDPWSGDFPPPGKWYWYRYKSGPNWRSKGYILYSHGPDGECVLGSAEDTGLIEDVPANDSNRDNVYHGRN